VTSPPEIDSMQDAKKAKEQRSDELTYLRERVAELERSEQERRHGEERLREKERRLAEFFRNAPIHRFLLLDSDLDIVAGNDILLDLFSTFFSLKREEIIGKNFLELIPGFEASDRHKQYLEVLRTGTPFYTDELAPPPEAGDVRISVSVFKAGDGLGIIATDVTERMRVERELQESEKKYATLVEQANDGIAIFQDGVIKFANKALTGMFGYSPDDTTGTPLQDHVTPELKAEVAEKHRLRMAGEALPPYELRVLHKDGTERDVELCGNLVQYEGRPASLAIIRDITQRKETAQTLKESEERFRALFEGSLDATVLTDPNSGHIVDANPAASELFLLDYDEMIGLHYTTFYPPRVQAYVREIWAKIVEGREETSNFETLVLRSDGQEVPIEGLAQIIQVNGVPFLYGAIRDISKRKEAEDALRKSEQRYRIFFDEAPTALWEIDASYVKEFADQVRKTGVGDFKDYFEGHPEEAVRCEKEVKLVEMNKASLELFEAGGQEEVLRNLRSILPREASPVYSGGIVAIAEGRTSFHRELVVNTLKGKEKHILYKWSILPGYEETASRILISLVDITARVQLEQERLKSQKIESLGVLAGGIAHDFNNLLTAISTNISMALLYGDLEDDISEMLGDAEKASDRAKNLTQQLLTFAKGGKPVKRTVSMDKLLRDTVQFALSGSNVKSVYSVPEDLWPVFVDEGQIGQIIHNLVINADQAMPGGGKVEIAVENVLVEGEEHLPLEKGKYVRLSVTDQGIGISGKHLDRIFDPFFTTKQKGSGLGLTTCFTIIRNHGGNIRAHSEADVGTRIDVFLPVSDEASEGRKRDEAIAMKGEGRILLIDDEEMIRRSAGEMLRRFGYDVTSAKDGEEALRYYKEAIASEWPFDAVIMDLTIRGGKGGRETIEELLTIDPDAKVIVSSGYSDDPVMSNFEEYGFRDIITKPYRLDEVGRVMRRVLSGAEA
jgi:PAS domain S-box-containing protein